MGTPVPDKMIVDYQAGGGGATNWATLYEANEQTSLQLNPPDGGAITFSRYFAYNPSSNLQEVVGKRKTGNPTALTANLSVPRYVTKQTREFIAKMYGVKNLRLRHFTGDYGTMTNYTKCEVYARCENANQDGVGEGTSFDGTAGKAADLARYKFPQEVEFYYELFKTALSRLSTSITTLSISRGCYFGYRRVAGEVVGEVGNNDGLQEFMAVTVADGSNLSHLIVTRDKGATTTDITLTGFTNFVGTDVAVVGDTVVISGSGAGGGLLWAKLADVLTGTVTFTRSTNIAAGVVINAVKRITSQKAIACGASGAVYVTSDSGRAFVSAGTAVTANALTVIEVVDETLQFLGGASGTLVRRMNGIMATVTVTGLSTTAINSLAVPKFFNRSTELYVGSAAGKVHATGNSTDTTPSWTTAYDAGSGAIDALEFAGPDSGVLWVVHTNGSTQSKLMRDISGGKFNYDLEDVSGYTSPANSTFNDISVAPFEPNVALIWGDANGGGGFVGVAA